jgi:putative membrane protein
MWGAARVDSIARRIGAWSRRRAADLVVRRALELRVEGLELVPSDGPALLVARHYHHLYDAAAILAAVPREVHIVVALDWVKSGLSLCAMRWLADRARWPGVWRAGATWRFNRDGYRLSLRLLREGRLLLVFPEAYPTIDPSGSRKAGPDQMLPFDAGFLALAERAGRTVPIVPVGVWYAPRLMTLRFGQPLAHSAAERHRRRCTLAKVEGEVCRLSRAPKLCTPLPPR